MSMEKYDELLDKAMYHLALSIMLLKSDLEEAQDQVRCACLTLERASSEKELAAFTKSSDDQEDAEP